ncbi:MAG: PIN domain-containing protein [Armatimonadetes bacterium]|nr:PIN domain-containing protein [Armatimonadota bacterium]
MPLLAAHDEHHAVVRALWDSFLAGQEELVSSSYVLLEAFALVQNRLGLDAVRALQTYARPVLTIEWVTEELHEAGVALLLAADRRPLSLVDCVSFEVMRRRGIRRVFALDPHFAEQGFAVVPPAA